MNYRIYQNITGWEYVATVNKGQLKKAISSFKDETYILIVQHTIQLDMDEVYYRGYAGHYSEKIKTLK